MERASVSMDWLADARRARGWTQEDIAEKLDVDIRTVQRWERGKCKPHPPKYRQLEVLFDRGPTPVQTKPPDASVVPAQAELDHSNDSTASRQETRPALIVVTSSVAGVRDTYTQFVAWDLGIRLDRIIRTWSTCRGNSRYHELQTLLSRELERKDDNTMQDNPINRRNALRRLASVPIELWGLSLAVPIRLKPFPFDDLLHQYAAGITALWYLRRGKDLSFVDSAVSRYIPTLEEMVNTSSGTQHQESASLLVQCLLLKATCVDLLYSNYATSLNYRKQAETVSEQAASLALSISTLRAQSTSYDYADNWQQAMYTAKKAAHLIETTEEGTPIPLMIQRYVYAGLANYQAHNGKKQDALTSLGQARATFDAAIANKETAPVCAGFDEGNLLLNSGLAYYHLGHSQQAINAFATISHLPESHETYRVESFIDQVMAEVYREDKPRDMDFCITRFKQGVQGAIAMRSEQKYTEAKNAYAAMRGAWPYEKRVKALSEYFKHW